MQLLYFSKQDYESIKVLLEVFLFACFVFLRKKLSQSLSDFGKFNCLGSQHMDAS